MMTHVYRENANLCVVFCRSGRVLRVFLRSQVHMFTGDSSYSTRLVDKISHQLKRPIVRDDAKVNVCVMLVLMGCYLFCTKIYLHSDAQPWSSSMLDAVK